MAPSAPRGRLALALAMLLPALAACGGDDDARPSAPEPAPAAEARPAEAPRPPPTFRLAVVTDLKGYLAPCGCTSRPLGGIDRMAALVRGLEGEGVPMAFVAAGSLFFDGVHRGDEGAVADRWRAEAVVDVWNELGLDAATPGRLDLVQGAGTLLALGARAGFPFLGAGVRLARPPSSPPPFREATTLTLGGVKVGLVGVSDLPPDPSGELVLPENAIAAGEAAVARIREEGAQVVVALAQGDRAFAHRVAAIAGVDFVVRGGIDRAEALPPAARDGAFELHAGHQGQGVLVVDVYVRGEGAFEDASPWTRRAEAAQREEEADALEARVAAWARDPSVRPDDLAEQRARLAAMRAEIERSARATLPETGNVFVAAFHELPPEAPRDASVSSALERFDRRVNEHNREIFADVLPPPAPAGGPTYVGSEACGRCHAAALRWWQGHPHGRAYETLAARHKEYHLDCVGCHVTGYNQPGGANVTHNLDGALTNVGCESCHGPGSLHVANPTAEPRTVRRDTPESTCVACHNEEHSDRFDFDVYRRRLLAPGHGMRAGS